jgi:uncharacterized protein (UPF0332 family)
MAEPDDKIFGERVFQQFMDLFITPEVRKRQEAGSLPAPVTLDAAQIIFFPDGRPPKVHINREVSAIGKVKLKKGVKKDKGDPIFLSDIDGIEDIQPHGEEFADCGHATLMKFGSEWTIAFNFVYNKALSRRHVDTAQQFLEAADFAYEKKLWSALVDNLFSASELCARSLLLGMPDEKYRSKGTHSTTHNRFNRFGSIGNVDPDHLSAFNRLSQLRSRARYVKSKLELDEAFAKQLLQAVKGLYEQARSRVQKAL